VMPSSDTMKVVDRASSNFRRLGWWAKEGPACNDHGRHADQYDWKSNMAAIGARSTMACYACKGCHPAPW
jgi:hypothetical protein